MHDIKLCQKSLFKYAISPCCSFSQWNIVLPDFQKCTAFSWHYQFAHNWLYHICDIKCLVMSLEYQARPSCDFWDEPSNNIHGVLNKTFRIPKKHENTSWSVVLTSLLFQDQLHCLGERLVKVKYIDLGPTPVLLKLSSPLETCMASTDLPPITLEGFFFLISVTKGYSCQRITTIGSYGLRRIQQDQHWGLKGNS